MYWDNANFSSDDLTIKENVSNYALNRWFNKYITKLFECTNSTFTENCYFFFGVKNTIQFRSTYKITHLSRPFLGLK